MQLSCSVIELAAEFSAANAVADAPASPVDAVRELLAWQCRESRLKAIVIAAAKGSHSNVPTVYVGEHGCREHEKEIVQAALKGYELLVLTGHEPQVLESFFEARGYKSRSEIDLGRLLLWNRSGLVAALEVALTFPSQAVCCFGHDADPVYLLRSSDLR